MRKYTSYAGQIEITATAYLLKRNIRVWILNKGKYQTLHLGYEIDPSKKDIHLFHNFGSGLPDGLHHFETLYPKKEFKSKPKTKKQKSKPKKQKPKTQKKQPSKTLKRQVVKEPAKRRKNKRTRRK